MLRSRIAGLVLVSMPVTERDVRVALPLASREPVLVINRLSHREQIGRARAAGSPAQL
jgi:hypothetical protein